MVGLGASSRPNPTQPNPTQPNQAQHSPIYRILVNCFADFSLKWGVWTLNDMMCQRSGWGWWNSILGNFEKILPEFLFGVRVWVGWCTMVCVRCVSDLLAAEARAHHLPNHPLDHFPILTLPPGGWVFKMERENFPNNPVKIFWRRPLTMLFG